MPMKSWELDVPDDILYSFGIRICNLIRLRKDYVKLMKFEFQYLLSFKLSHRFSHTKCTLKSYDMLHMNYMIKYAVQSDIQKVL